MIEKGELARQTYKLADALCDLRLHMEATDALMALIEFRYFEPSTQLFLETLTEETWDAAQLNMYTLANLMSATLKECQRIEEAAAALAKATREGFQHAC